MDKATLVNRCQSGDRDAFGILYNTYLFRMRKVVSYYVRNNDDVKDILHDGFIIAFTSINNLKDKNKIESWLTSIMKNLALQHVKEQADKQILSIPDISTEDDSDPASHLGWEDLDKIISQLPKGYNNVFRLAVLDGLTHKEIGTLLHIAPHSSSSQLTHAKAMLRRLITRYRIQTGIMSIIVIICTIWYSIFRQKHTHSSTTTISRDNNNHTTSTVMDSMYKDDRLIPESHFFYKTVPSSPIQSQAPDYITKNQIPMDTIYSIGKDSIPEDTLILKPIQNNRDEYVIQKNVQSTIYSKPMDWSLSLTYSGNPSKNGVARYSIPGSTDLPSQTPEDITITEKTRHHMPIVVGVLLNKSLTQRWSIETGLRYTFLKSDILSESKQINKEITQTIHYIGIPLKVNYNIFRYKGLSLYLQGGGALDIPINGNQSVTELSTEWTPSQTDRFYIHAPWQWSIEGGVGIQHRFTTSFSIYVEPSIRYYFDPESNVRTIRQDNPFEFTIPIGLRLTW